MKHTYLYINIECSWSHKANLASTIYDFVLSSNSLIDLTANYSAFANKIQLSTNPYVTNTVESTLLESPVRLDTFSLIRKTIRHCTVVRDVTLGLYWLDDLKVSMKEINPDFSKVVLTYTIPHKINPCHVRHLCFLSYFYRKDRHVVEDCLCAIAEHGRFNRQPKVNLSEIFDPYAIAENS